MRHRLRILLPAVAALLLCASPAFALTLDEVVDLINVGVPDTIIVTTIQGSDTVFNLTAEQIVDLKKKGASDAVIQALQATAGTQTRSGSSRTEEEGPRVRDRSSEERERPSSTEEEAAPRRSGGEDEEAAPRRSSSEDEEAAPRRGTSSEEEAPRRSSSSSRELDEEDSAIRRRGSSRSRDSEEEDAGERSGKVKRTPKEIKAFIDLYKEKKVATASLKGYRLLEEKKYPEQEPKIRYYLGASLKDMGMLHAAQVYFQDVVKAGPSTGALYTGALAKMVEISDLTKDPIYLIRSIDKIHPDDYPGKVKDDLYYYQGVRDFERKDYAAAKRNFAKVAKSSDHFVQARYHLGVVYNAQDRKQQAFKTFADIVNGDFNGDIDTVTHVKQLSYLNMARIRYGVEQYQKAADLYLKLPRLTEYWPNALYESAWAFFMAENRESKALGQVMTIKSPFFDRVWMPEARILEALTFNRICEYKKVEGLLDAFKAEYEPIKTGIDEMLQPYTDGTKPLKDLYQRLYGKDSKDWRRLPVAVYAHVEANRNFAGPHNRVLEIEKELAHVAQQKSSWRDSEVGKGVGDLLKKQRGIYMKLAGTALANALGGVRDQLADLLGQEAIIRFEIVSGEYKKYERRYRNPEAAEVAEGVQFDFATNPDLIYWPFNGEFWADELGYYERVEPGSCKE